MLIAVAEDGEWIDAEDALREINRLRSLIMCGTCGDEFTQNDRGTCGNCLAGETAALHVEIERLEAEHLSLLAAVADNRSLRQMIDAELECQADGQDADATVCAIRKLLDERDALRADLAAERERCAKICDGVNSSAWKDPARTCADWIRGV